MKNNTYILKKNPVALNVVDNKFFLIQCLLVSIHLVVLLGFVCYQFYQPLYLNSSTWVFAYLVLFVSFSIDCLYFYFHEKVKEKLSFQWLFLFLDAALMTVCLSAAFSILYPVLIFVYMLHIFSAGLLGQYKGAFAQGLLVSFLFSWLLILNPSGLDSSQSLIFSFVLNNFGFMVVAGLSGFFGQQSNKMQWSLIEADRVVSHLENLNELIVTNINMGLFILDEETFVIHSNKAASHILGLPSAFSAPISNVFPEVREYIVSNKHDEINRLEVNYHNGSNKRAIEIFISSIKDCETGMQKYLILFQDYTKIREMEKAVQDKEKFASIGRMAAGIAHEIRNPLSSIGGSIQLLDIHEKNPAENQRLMDIALREISRLNRIIGEFLDYARDENPAMEELLKMEYVQVNSVLEELLDSVRVNPKWEHISYHFILKSHGLVQGNTDRFKQIFFNIVKNACEAMEAEPEGQLEIESFDDNEWVVVRVKDVGTGISDEDKSHIYEPFYSKKEKGTGLGLAIVRKLVLLYKGHLSYENRDNQKGTICTLRFPIQPNLHPGEMAQSKSA